MPLDLKNTLKELCDIAGPSGFEPEIARYCAKLLREYMDEVHIDRASNVIALRRCGRENAIKLLFDAHIDEIGMIITGIEEGFLRFAAIGGVDPRMLVAREVRIMTEPPIVGVVCATPPHLLSGTERDKAMEIKDLYIDAGFSHREAVRRIKTGTPAVFCGETVELAANSVSGKAMDDRACFLTILRALELLEDVSLNADLYVLASSQEEIGGRGAKTGVFGIAPDYCVAVDVTHAHTPDASRDKTLKPGGGPAIGIGPNMTRSMSDALVKAASDNNIPCQLEVMEGSSGTNGWTFQISREGIPTAVVSVPLKYMHTPVETVLISDIESTARLLAEFTRRFTKEGLLC